MIQNTAGGEYIAAGWTEAYGAGNSDVWVLKLDAEGGIDGCSNVVTTFPTITVTNLTANNPGLVASNSSAASASFLITQSSTAITPGQVCSADYIKCIMDYYKVGSGSGTVTSFPAGINCSGDCTAYFSAGLLAFSATAVAGSLFAGWGGACDDEGQVILDADKSCTATFDLCSEKPAKVSSNSYDTIGEAYVAASNTDLIRLIAFNRAETLNFNLNKTITLRGGYDCDYESVIAGVNTTILGAITISDGTIIVDGVTIK